MITSDDFNVDSQLLTFKSDKYPISKIKRVRVKTNTLRDHAMKIFIVGLIVSSVVWVICPEGFGKLTAPIALLSGMLAALASVRKYELQIEFMHIDETGLQWVSVAKANKAAIKSLFQKQANLIAQNIT